MKTFLKFFQTFLLMCGVFAAETDERKTVMEGDSVTLKPDITQIQGITLMLWKFGGPFIVQIERSTITYSKNKMFIDRLQLNQTGSLTIKNMRTKHSGLYELEINHGNGTTNKKFSVIVYDSPPVIDAAEAEMKIVSVIEGASVTLHVPQLYGDELIVWRSGYEGKLIAKYDIEAKSPPLYNTDERFRDRLQLNDQTGSLIITNSRTTDSGLYTGKISSNKQTLYKRFTVTVSVQGLSPGAVAGIVVVVLLVSAAAAVGVFYYRHKITNLPSQKWSVPTGDNVTLNPETEIQTGDEIQWLFGAEDTVIAENKKDEKMPTHDGPGKILMNAHHLDKMTGSLTITSINTEHTGLYTLKIRRGRETLNKKYQVSVKEMMKPVTEGDPVTLYPDIIMQTNDEIQWLSNKWQQTVIAEIITGEMYKYDGPDWRFRNRLELNKKKGSLTITKCTAAHTGFYTLKIRRDRETLYDRFFISVEKRRIEVMEGQSVNLEPATEINEDDFILWLFRDAELLTGIAEFNVKTRKISTYADVAGERFKDKLKLNKTTGSLTITNTRTAHSGLYKLQIRSSSGVSEQTFIVTVKAAAFTNEVREKSVMNENNDSTEERVNESVTVVMPLLGGENLDVVNDEEGTSLL